MRLELVDWLIIVLFFGVSLTIGAVVSKRAGRNAESFFLSGRNMPWWLLGISMVATTFAADTPLLVTDIVRNNGDDPFIHLQVFKEVVQRARRSRTSRMPEPPMTRLLSAHPFCRPYTRLETRARSTIYIPKTL